MTKNIFKLKKYKSVSNCTREYINKTRGEEGTIKKKTGEKKLTNDEWSSSLDTHTHMIDVWIECGTCHQIWIDYQNKWVSEWVSDRKRVVDRSIIWFGRRWRSVRPNWLSSALVFSASPSSPTSSGLLPLPLFGPPNKLPPHQSSFPNTRKRIRIRRRIIMVVVVLEGSSQQLTLICRAHSSAGKRWHLHPFLVSTVPPFRFVTFSSFSPDTAPSIM